MDCARGDWFFYGPCARMNWYVRLEATALERYEKLTDLLPGKEAEAAIVLRPENMRWLSGYTGEGCLFVCEKARVIVTDFRYTEMAERQAPGFRVEMTTAQRTGPAVCAELMEEFSLSSAATETDYVTHDSFVALERALSGKKLLSMTGTVEKLREIKDEGELSAIRESARIACKAFENLLGWVKVGMTEKEIQIGLDYEMLKLGSERNAFDTIACAGVNGSLPHAVPSDHRVQNGELLTLDFGATTRGYLSDMTRTIGFGRIDGELRRIYQAVLDAQLLCLDAVAPGKVCGEIDKIARDFLDAKYPGRFGHGLGHGVGLFIHEGPRFSRGSETVLEPGHVLTVEPGLYIPGLGGCRIEDMVLITQDGYVDPIDAPKRLIEL